MVVSSEFALTNTSQCGLAETKRIHFSPLSLTRSSPFQQVVILSDDREGSGPRGGTQSYSGVWGLV